MYWIQQNENKIGFRDPKFPTDANISQVRVLWHKTIQGFNSVLCQITLDFGN